METAALKAASFSGLVWSGTGNRTCGILGFDSTLPLKKHAATPGSVRVERVSSSRVSVGQTEDVGSLRLELQHWVHLLSVLGKALWVLSTVQQTLCPRVQSPPAAQAPGSCLVPQQWACRVESTVVLLQAVWWQAHSYTH